MYAEASTWGYSRCQTSSLFRPGTVFHVKLSRPARRATLVVHVAASACWLGLTLGLLVLGITATTTGSAETVEASVRAMKLFADWLLLPLAFFTFLSGLVLSLGTPWGLTRHRWVYTKFWLTLATMTATVFALRPGVDSAVAAVSAGGPLPDVSEVLAGPIVSLSAYVFMTVISVLKPWGLTRRGQNLRIAARKSVDVEHARQTA
ncbi:membrane protein [Streptomyces vastus]|uniref:Membrane protein n=1 Tax=Streptomyces vastus TaxID=285451 RepID=A0ABP6DUS8_9ACTN